MGVCFLNHTLLAVDSPFGIGLIETLKSRIYLFSVHEIEKLNWYRPSVSTSNPNGFRSFLAKLSVAGCLSLAKQLLSLIPATSTRPRLGYLA
jgi:hypothetical protein